jgi:transcription elongation factor GreB
VTYATREGEEQTVRIVGIDETDSAKRYVSWISPVARALIKAREGDTVNLHTPAGVQELEILEVRYEEIPMAPFQPVQSLWSPNSR